ncbi:hypothetical protein BDP27DRAFT_1409167, partial [Rhodocollybia butyracea]
MRRFDTCLAAASNTTTTTSESTAANPLKRKFNIDTSTVESLWKLKKPRFEKSSSSKVAPFLLPSLTPTYTSSGDLKSLEDVKLQTTCGGNSTHPLAYVFVQELPSNNTFIYHMPFMLVLFAFVYLHFRFPSSLVAKALRSQTNRKDDTLKVKKERVTRTGSGDIIELKRVFVPSFSLSSIYRYRFRGWKYGCLWEWQKRPNTTCNPTDTSCRQIAHLSPK